MLNSKTNENKKFITCTAGAGLQTRANHYQSNYLKNKNLHFFSKRLKKNQLWVHPIRQNRQIIVPSKKKVVIELHGLNELKFV